MITGQVFHARAPLQVEDLPNEALQRIVRQVQAALFETVHSDTGEPVLDPDNEWDSDTLDAIGAVIQEAGLWPDPVRLFVNVYLTDRAYGGPEEGGWWYDVGRVQTSTEVLDMCEARRQRNTLNAWCERANAERRSDTGSVLSDGQYVVRIEHAAAADYPATRPRYE